ncbi:MAG: DnaJ C-terminal domain-containing protein [Alphaproteobacteria bacterium]|nr:DnaJ C-terminal domain-containing protein [Alphaproteobacteria bacterium]
MSWDPYAALGVSRSASADEIRSAYRKLAKELHPDVRPNDKAAEDRFKRATAAFNLLGDPATKARFDRGEVDAEGNEKQQTHAYRTGAGRTQNGYSGAGESVFDLGDIFSDLFGSAGAAGGGARQPPFGKMRGRDIRLPLDIDFLESVRGGRKRVQMSDGRTLDVAIPPGVIDGQVLRLKSQGGGGVQGGPPGDALVELKIRPHAFFRREGDDIHLDLQISIVEAVEGAKIQVPTASGSVALTIPEGSNTGKTLRLKGKGVGERGDQLVHLKVMMPDVLDEDLKRFVKKWGRRDYTPPRPPG